MTSSPPIRIRWGRVGALLAAIAAVAAALGTGRPASAPSMPAAPRTHPLGEDDGAIPDGTTVFDDDVPGVARLDPDLLEALRRAANDAGVRFAVDSGWRSAAYQTHLRRDAIDRYGSQAEAARWVATPKRSAHVKGEAVDIADPTGWLAAHGAAYGLCRIYANEPWHFELRPAAADHGCPPVYADPTHDPRTKP